MTTFSPQTPSLNRRAYSLQHKPNNSSPLAWSPASSSPSRHSGASSSVDRRRSQYKSTLSSRTKSMHVTSSSPIIARSLFSDHNTPTPDRNALLQAKFQEKLLNKAVRERQRKLERRQGRLKDAHSEAERERKLRQQRMMSSDGFDEDMDMDDDEDDEEDIPDDLFQRIMVHTNRKLVQREYLITYAREVGPSSCDPALEDPARWEEEMLGPTRQEEDYYDEEEELAAYAEEALAAEERERKKAETEWDSVPLDDLIADMTDEELVALSAAAASQAAIPSTVTDRDVEMS